MAQTKTKGPPCLHPGCKDTPQGDNIVTLFCGKHQGTIEILKAQRQLRKGLIEQRNSMKATHQMFLESRNIEPGLAKTIGERMTQDFNEAELYEGIDVFQQSDLDPETYVLQRQSFSHEETLFNGALCQSIGLTGNSLGDAGLGHNDDYSSSNVGEGVDRLRRLYVNLDDIGVTLGDLTTGTTDEVAVLVQDFHNYNFNAPDDVDKKVCMKANLKRFQDHDPNFKGTPTTKLTRYKQNVVWAEFMSKNPDIARSFVKELVSN